MMSVVVPAVHFLGCSGSVFRILDHAARARARSSRQKSDSIASDSAQLNTKRLCQSITATS